MVGQKYKSYCCKVDYMESEPPPTTNRYANC